VYCTGIMAFEAWETSPALLALAGVCVVLAVVSLVPPEVFLTIAGLAAGGVLAKFIIRLLFFGDGSRKSSD